MTARVHLKCRHFNTQRSECGLKHVRRSPWGDGCPDFGSKELCEVMNICPVYVKRGNNMCQDGCSMKIALDWVQNFDEKYREKPLGCSFYPEGEEVANEDVSRGT